ncbi:hypothetical protein [Actinomadura hibisca]|uniref:hypothetical protein n=1 Tax=Actinomadura hibisca TaxID=68565 RepID=UPI0008365DC1|nr:hypothetical protein [Actinomadura hibisca]
MINEQVRTPDARGADCALHHPDGERHRLRHLLLVGMPAPCAPHDRASDGGAAPVGLLSTSPFLAFGEELATVDRFISYWLHR